MKQVKEDMQTNKEVLHDIYGLPFIFFERPAWDKFAGAFRTFASDVLNPDGKVIQQPSTHIISPSFAEAFAITYKDKDGKEKPAYTTCYGPAISRIFASVIIVHGDDKGLKFPWEIAPINVMIVPISPDDKKLMKKAEELKEKIQEITSVEIDVSDKTPGEKFNHWEMKGVPIRIDIGLKDLDKKQVTLFRRDLDKKIEVREEKVLDEIKKISKEFTSNLIQKADKIFEGRIKKTQNLKEIKSAIKEGMIAQCEFCSVEKDGTLCAEKIKEEADGAEVRGTKLDEKMKPKGKCAVCGKPSKEIVYIAKSY
jgi:prolyl-tRNA synthetase